MTYDKLIKGNDLSNRIKNLEASIFTVSDLLEKAKQTQIYEDGPDYKLQMEIKPIGWSGIRVNDFSSDFIEKVLLEYRAGLEHQLRIAVRALEDL